MSMEVEVLASEAVAMSLDPVPVRAARVTRAMIASRVLAVETSCTAWMSRTGESSETRGGEDWTEVMG